MPDNAKHVFLVDDHADPIVIRVHGRASFQNASSVADFIADRIKQGRLRFVIDFKECQSMDSTFLGTLAGAGLQLRKRNPAGSLVLARLGQRNLDLVRNLGLHRLCLVDGGEGAVSSAGVAAATPLRSIPKSEAENARLVLAAHESLIAADSANAAKFEDVVSLLRKRVDQK